VEECRTLSLELVNLNDLNLKEVGILSDKLARLGLHKLGITFIRTKVSQIPTKGRDEQTTSGQKNDRDLA